MLQFDKMHLKMGGFTLSADWALPVGSMTAVVGPSGAGKSSLLLALAGFLTPSMGRIMWNDTDLTPQDAARRPVSILFQDQNLFPHLTLQHNVLLGLTAGRRPRADQAIHAQQALDRVGLGGMGARKPHQVSGGQMARAGLARVLLQARPILVLDEPFAALDAALRTDMVALLCKVARETHATVLMVSHDLRDAQQMASHVVTVSNGLCHAPVAAADFFKTGK